MYLAEREMWIKRPIVVNNLLDGSVFGILHALTKGETDPEKLAQVLATSAEPGSARCCRQQGQSIQIATRRLLPRLGYQAAIWAVAQRIPER